MSRLIRQFLVLLLSLAAALPAQVSVAQTAIHPDPEVDNRLGIVVRPNERNRLLHSMRKYLVGLQAMSEALAREDMLTAAAAARSMGSINIYEVRLMFPTKPGIDFRELAFEVHRDFDVVARDAEARQDPKLMLAQLAAIMKKCTHCHDTYKLQDRAH
jgi:hypothetical protein